MATTRESWCLSLDSCVLARDAHVVNGGHAITDDARAVETEEGFGRILPPLEHANLALAERVVRRHKHEDFVAACLHDS